MSYQNSELMARSSNSENKETNTTFWKCLVVFSGLAALGLMVYSIDIYKNPAVAKVTDLQLAKEGVISYSSLSSSEKETLFDDFKAQFGKAYSKTEEREKFKNFESFLELVDERNSLELAAGGTGCHGITKFADMSDEEFRSNFLGFKVDDLPSALSKGKNGDSLASTTTQTQTQRNWEGALTTPVKDQGYCGSCWAFSAAQQLESDAIKAGYLNTTDRLSPQQIVSWYKLNYLLINDNSIA